jgi:hypothetical protein
MSKPTEDSAFAGALTKWLITVVPTGRSGSDQVSAAYQA